MYAFYQFPFIAWKNGKVLIGTSEKEKEHFAITYSEDNLSTIGGHHIFAPLERWFIFKTIQDNIAIVKHFMKEAIADFEEIKEKRKKTLLPDFIMHFNCVAASMHEAYERLYYSYFGKDAAENVTAYAIRNAFCSHEIVQYYVITGGAYEEFEEFTVTTKDTLTTEKLQKYFPILRLGVYEKSYPLFSEGIILKSTENATNVEMIKAAFYAADSMSDFNKSCIKLGIMKNFLQFEFPEFSITPKVTNGKKLAERYEETMACADKVRSFRDKLYLKKGDQK